MKQITPRRSLVSHVAFAAIAFASFTGLVGCGATKGEPCNAKDNEAYAPFYINIDYAPGVYNGDGVCVLLPGSYNSGAVNIPSGGTSGSTSGGGQETTPYIVFDGEYCNAIAMAKDGAFVDLINATYYDEATGQNMHYLTRTGNATSGFNTFGILPFDPEWSVYARCSIRFSYEVKNAGSFNAYTYDSPVTTDEAYETDLLVPVGDAFNCTVENISGACSLVPSEFFRNFALEGSDLPSYSVDGFGSTTFVMQTR